MIPASEAIMILTITFGFVIPFYLFFTYGIWWDYWLKPKLERFKKNKA
jgi:hypothetical protein